MKLHKKLARLAYDALTPALVCFALITLEFSVITDGGYSELYGLPLPWISEIWVFSGHNSIFILPLALNFSLFLGFWMLALRIFPQLRNAPAFLRHGTLIFFLLLGLQQAILNEDTYSLWHDGEFTITGSRFCFAYSCEDKIVTDEVEVVDLNDDERPQYPIDQFYENSTLKQFGTYVSPGNSPVEDERFTGFHTGIDVEYPGDEEIWVYSIGEGEVLRVQNVNGYGGVIQIYYAEEGITALYGHLDLSTSQVSAGDFVSAGQELATLGDGYSEETDGERKHLHFSLKPGWDTDLRGYVSQEVDLSEWIDPELFFQTKVHM